jgi:hypothetical protein
VDEVNPAPRPTQPQYERYRRSDVFTVGAVIGKSFSIWGRKLPTLLVIMVVVYTPFIAYKALQVVGEPFQPETWQSGVEMAGALLLSFIAQAAVIYAVLQELRAEPVRVGESLRVALVRFLPVLGVTLVMLVCIAVGGAIMGLGAVLGGPVVFLILLPLGLFWFGYLMCALWVTVPAVVVERAGIGALGRSFELTKGHKWRILGILAILLAVQWALSFVVVFAAIASVKVGIVLEVGASLLIGALTATAAAVGYHDLRRAKEGVGVEDLLQVFE